MIYYDSSHFISIIENLGSDKRGRVERLVELFKFQQPKVSKLLKGEQKPTLKDIGTICTKAGLMPNDLFIIKSIEKGGGVTNMDSTIQTMVDQGVKIALVEKDVSGIKAEIGEIKEMLKKLEDVMESLSKVQHEL